MIDGMDLSVGITEIHLWKLRCSPRLYIKVHQLCSALSLASNTIWLPQAVSRNGFLIAQLLWQNLLLPRALHRTSRIWHHKREKISVKTSPYVSNHHPMHTINSVKSQKFERCIFLAAQSILPYIIRKKGRWVRICPSIYLVPSDWVLLDHNHCRSQLCSRRWMALWPFTLHLSYANPRHAWMHWVYVL